MTRLPALLFCCLLWACLFVGSRSAEGSFPKPAPQCPVTVNLPDPVAFTHDARGNLLNDGQPLLAYDAEDQLTSIRVPPTATASGWETQFVYDGLGRLRIRREITVPATGSTTARTTNQVRYLYDGFTAVQERDGNNAVLATYTRGNDLSGSPQGAGGIGGLLARTDAAGSLFYHSDAGGNVTTLFNASQAVVGRYAYDPFGNLLGMSGASAAGNRYRFSSKEVHPQTGIYYYGFRFYEPNLQRWTSRDPIEEMGGLNLYGFVGNEPTDFIDPDGLASAELGWGEALGILFWDAALGDRFSGRRNPAAAGAHIGGTFKGSDGNTYLPGDVGIALGGQIASPVTDRLNPVPLLNGMAMGQVGKSGGMLGMLGKAGKAECKLAASKLPRFNGPKPTYLVNPAHVPGRGLRPGKTPLPPDAEAVFKNAVPNDPKNPTAWFGRNSNGQIYRFSSDRNGTAHFSGIDGVGDGTRNLTPYARDRLNGL